MDNIHTVIEKLYDTALNSQWDEVEKTFLPAIRTFNPDEVAPRLMQDIRDENSDIRLVILMALSETTSRITNPLLKQEVIETIIERATEDPDALPTLYAGCVLLSCNPDESQEKAVLGAIAACRARTLQKGWEHELESFPLTQHSCLSHLQTFTHKE